MDASDGTTRHTHHRVDSVTSTTTVLVVAGADTDTTSPLALDEEKLPTLRAEGPIDGLKRLSEESVDCVVVDHHLSSLSIEQFLSELRADRPNLPVIVVGDTPSPDSLLQLLSDADTTYLQAPTSEELLNHVKRTIARHRADHALNIHARLKELCWEIAGEVATPTSRTAVEQTVYDRLMASGLYRFAWVGTYETATDQLSLSVPIVGTFGPEQLDSLAGEDREFVERAVRTGTVTVADSAAPTRSASNVRRPGDSPAPVSTRRSTDSWLRSATVPLEGGDTVHGVLLLTSDRADAFDGAAVDVLETLGRVVGSALERLEMEDSAGVETVPASSQEVEQVVETVEEFSRTLAHELRGPLGLALAHLELGRETGDSEELDRVESALEQIETVVDHLSTVAGVDDVETSTRRDFEADAEEAWAQVEAPNATLEVVDSAPIEADHDLVVWLFSNLFRNAVTHAGSDVTIRVGRLGNGVQPSHSNATDETGFFVQDDGDGIPSENRDNVFDRGFTTLDDGLGIGLSIVKTIAEAHGWDITVTEGSGGGARFEISGVDFQTSQAEG